jgi:hypothetical protein
LISPAAIASDTLIRLIGNASPDANNAEYFMKSRRVPPEPQDWFSIPSGVRRFRGTGQTRKGRKFYLVPLAAKGRFPGEPREGVASIQRTKELVFNPTTKDWKRSARRGRTSHVRNWSDACGFLYSKGAVVAEALVPFGQARPFQGGCELWRR